MCRTSHVFALIQRLTFANDPAVLQRAFLSKDEEQIASSKLDRLAEELRALGIEF